MIYTVIIVKYIIRGGEMNQDFNFIQLLTGGGLVLIGTIASAVINNIYSNKNFKKQLAFNENETLKKNKNKEKEKLFEVLEKIISDVENDFQNYRYIMNAYKVGGKNEIDRLGGYRMNITTAKSLAFIYFSELHMELEIYESQAGKWFNVTLSKGYKTSQRGNAGDISEKDIEEEDKFHKSYKDLFDNIKSEIEKLKNE